MVNNRKRRWTRVGNRIGVWMYSTLNGRLSSGSKDVHVLMITTPGRRTGIPRSTCVRYLQTARGLVVWGTGSGSKQDPDWFRNLRTVDVADVQVKANRLQVRPREVVGPEREDLWKNSSWPKPPRWRSTPGRRAGLFQSRFLNPSMSGRVDASPARACPRQIRPAPLQLRPAPRDSSGAGPV